MDGESVFIVNPKTGTRSYVPRAELGTWEKAGYQVETEGETQDARLQEEYGDSPVQAGLEGAASAITFGGSDLALRGLDPEGARERRERNSLAAGVGMVGGALLSGGMAAGGALTGAGKAAEAAIVGEGASIGTRVAGAATRGVVEGAGYGAGAGVGEVALSEDPITWEGAAATIGSNVLGGAVIGGAIGVGGHLLAEGATAAKGYANKQLTKLAEGDAAAVERGAFPEVANMDAKAAGKRRLELIEEHKVGRAADIVEGGAAKKAEEASLSAAKDAEAANVYKEAEAYVKELKTAPRIQVAEGESMDATVLGKKKLKVMMGLDNESEFIRSRGKNTSFVKGLEERATVLKRVLGDADEVMANAEAKQQAMLDALPQPKAPLEPDHWMQETAAGRLAREAENAKVGLSLSQARQYAEWAGVKMPKGKSMAISPEELVGFRSAIEAGEIVHPDILRVQQAQAQMGKTQEWLDRIAKLQEKPTSLNLQAIDERIAKAVNDVKPSGAELKAVEAHLSDLQAPKGLGHAIAQGAGGLAGGAAGMAALGPIGAMAGGFLGRDIGSRVYERLVKKLVSNNAARAKTIKQTIAGMFASGAGKVAKAMPQATKIIPAIQYATHEHATAMMGPENTKPSKNALVTDFRQRARELNSVTERKPDGTYAVRMQAMEAMHERTQGLWAVAPGVANGVEKTQWKKLAFLASKLPRNPAPPTLQAGPDTWEAGPAEIAKFARFMHAAEHPEAVVENVAAGKATPEDVETLREIYPSHYEDVRQQCMTHMATLQRTLPYVQRLNLSILLDVEVDPALTQEAMSVYQRPPPQSEQDKPPAASKPLPMGMVAPTNAQRMSSK